MRYTWFTIYQSTNNSIVEYTPRELLLFHKTYHVCEGNTTLGLYTSKNSTTDVSCTYTITDTYDTFLNIITSKRTYKTFINYLLRNVILPG